MTVSEVAADLARVATAPSSALIEELAAAFVDRHGRPERHYHTLDHARAARIDVGRWSVVAGLDEATAQVVGLAAWYHDVIYDGRPGDDEAASADVLADHLCLLYTSPSPRDA